MRPALVLLTALLAVLAPAAAQPAPGPAGGGPAEVLFVLGSDTSTPGIAVARRTTVYKSGGFALFSSPTGPAARVMDDAFRARYTDAYGRPLRLTWWMQNGSLYRDAENTNVPLPSTMSMYLMRAYHGDAVERLGDELTFHYHTWEWSDENGDGRFFWNQARTFNDAVRADFDRTVADGLLYEGVYPESFRSGWHFMDDAWQARLDELLPFSLHNDAPLVHDDRAEPIDNLFDWSRAPLDFVPFRPLATDYQRPGGTGGWNVRSVFFGRVTEAMVRGLFESARDGETQVACFWDHLADAAFIPRLEDVLGIIESVAADFPDVPFRYETGAEAMRRWQGRGDDTPPALTLEPIAGGTAYRLTASEPIFQPAPFVAALDRYERTFVVEAERVGPLTWETTTPLDPAALAKVAAAMTDSAGHNATAFHRLLPDDVFVDNGDAAYAESAGAWMTLDATAVEQAWGPDLRFVPLADGQEAWASFEVTAPAPARYHAFTRLPGVDRLPPEVTASLVVDGTTVAEETHAAPGPDTWLFAGAADLAEGQVATVVLRATGVGPPGAVLAADAVRLTALVRDRQLALPGPHLDFGDAVAGEPTPATLRLRNLGTEPLTVSGLRSTRGTVEADVALPFVLGGMEVSALPLRLVSDAYGLVRDTLVVESDDPADPARSVPVQTTFRGAFALVDDGDGGYEERGPWRTSVTQAHGSSSRYVGFPTAGADATFTLRAPRSGTHALSFVLPASSNSALRAGYDVGVDGEPRGSYVVDQNAPGVAWRALATLDLAEGATVTVRVHADDDDQPGRVLRTDAVLLEHIGAGLDAAVLDDADPEHYAEVGGTWATSTAQAFGPSSRYAPWGGDPRATFATNAATSGPHAVEVIVPVTENASREARYRISRNGFALDSLVLDQNVESGTWRLLGTWPLEAGDALAVEVSNAESESSARVLRADAVRLRFRGAVASEPPAPDRTARLDAPHPNPSRGPARVAFRLGAPGPARLDVFDTLGRRVAVLAEGLHGAGVHHAALDPDRLGLAAGLYVLRLQTGDGIASRRWVVAR